MKFDIHRVLSSISKTYLQSFTKDDLLKEEWKEFNNIDVKYKAILNESYNNLYLLSSYYISNIGRVGRLLYKDTKLTILPIFLSNNDLKISIKSVNYSIHKLVALAFLDNDDLLNKKIVCRNNPSDIYNNRVSNLYWGTRYHATLNRKKRSINLNTTNINSTTSNNKGFTHTNEPIVKLDLNNNFIKLYLNSIELKNDSIANTNNITRQCKYNKENNICNSIKEGYKWMFLSQYNKIILDDYIKETYGDNIILKLTPNKAKKIISIYNSVNEILEKGYNLYNIIQSCLNNIITKCDNKKYTFMFMKDYLNIKKYNSVDDIVKEDYL